MNHSLPPDDQNPNPAAPPIEALPQLFEQYRSRLRLLVQLRIDQRVNSRIDASDVIQEAFAEAVSRYPKFLAEAKLTPYVWLRFLTLQQLLIAHRRHLGTQMRSVVNERPLDLGGAMLVDSGSVARCLIGSETSPSMHVSRQEEIERLTAVLQQMDPIDREILTLRHFEQLEYAEIAEILELNRSTVASRYRRALKKIGQEMSDN